MRHNTTTTQSPQNKKVGVVIPIYNVAEYLRECLDSVINQTYKNLSIVLVNDGSTDNNESLNIAKEYVAKDSRFILIDKENGGLSSARNVGIAWFSEKYEAKLDSSINLESSTTYTIDSTLQYKDKVEPDLKATCHTEPLSEVSNMESNFYLDSEIDSNKDFSPMTKNNKNLNSTQNTNYNNRINSNNGGGGVTLYSYNITNENPYNIYKIYTASTHATQHTESTNLYHATTTQQEFSTDSKTLKSNNSQNNTDESQHKINNINHHKDSPPHNTESIYNINTTNNHNSTLQPQKIDYIIFLDSDDYWKPYCIEECIKHSDGVDIVWFESECFLNGEIVDCGDLHNEYGIFTSQMLTKTELIRAKRQHETAAFYLATMGFMDFHFLYNAQLYFLDNIIHEDHNFGLLLILQCNNIFALCESLYCVRLRPNSITRFDSKNPHIVPHCKHIYQAFNNARLAKQYHIASSWFLMLLELIQFLKDHPNKDNETIEQLFFPYYIQHSLKLFDFKHDPLNLIPKLPAIEPYLKKGFKYRHKLRITNPKKYKLLGPLFSIYDSIKSIERGIRKYVGKNKR